MKNDRIVITGMGVVACNGRDPDELTKNVNANISGIKECTRHDMSGLKSQLAGQIDYDRLYEVLPNEDDVEKTIYLAYYAAQQAIAEAGIDFAAEGKNVAIVLGSLFGGFNTSVYVHEEFLKDSKLTDIDISTFEYFSPCSIPSYLSKKFGIKGAKIVVSNACASGGSAVGMAYDLIRSGLADMAIAGGADELNRLSLAGFNSLGALNPNNCTPYTNSVGINIGEGAGVFVLEKLSDAQERGAKPQVEIVGYELSSDAFHITSPDPNGDGAYRTMKAVLERNNITVDEVSYVNGHGTGTNGNDSSETKSVKRLFADSGIDGKLISNKGVVGHCMGAAGAVELFVAARSVVDGMIPPTYHGEKQKELAGIEIVKEATPDPCSFVLSNSFAFGGNNITVGISAPGHFDAGQLDNEMLDDDVVITGIGCVGNKHTSFEEYIALLAKGDTEFLANEEYQGKYASVYHGMVPEYDYRRYMSPDFFRKTDLISKFSLVSSVGAMKDADLKVTRANEDRIGLVYGTGTGPISTIEKLNLDIVQKGLPGMNAFFFPNSVCNAAPGYITMNSRIKGTTITINCGGATFASSVLYAKMILQQNKADYVIVTVADDYNEIYHAAYDRIGHLHKTSRIEEFFGQQNTTILSPGSVSVMMERKQTAAERGAKVYAKVLGGVLTGSRSGEKNAAYTANAMYETYEATLAAVNLTESDIDVYFSANAGRRSTDAMEKQGVIDRLDKTIVSSARQFSGTNAALVPAYSALSAVAAFSGAPVYDILNGGVAQNDRINNVMIASHAFDETFSNLVICRA
ncbi:MAG: beta-ketoacyl-[acyl-carrier-protein] synthase family protein [Defluviitaleaceae bacterium]|nr:beta-ketoacyl-[acyl-carrier-protein] synthase family protein [Defluviitaleaceae bacterium]